MKWKKLTNCTNKDINHVQDQDTDTDHTAEAEVKIDIDQTVEVKVEVDIINTEETEKIHTDHVPEVEIPDIVGVEVGVNIREISIP